MSRTIGSTNIRPTRTELSKARRLTKRRAIEGDPDALAALATHRLADVLENALGALAGARGDVLDTDTTTPRL